MDIWSGAHVADGCKESPINPVRNRKKKIFRAKIKQQHYISI